MLTKTQKAKLINEIYKMINESVFENYYFEDGENRNDKDDYSAESDEDKGKRGIVNKWLDSAQELHSVLSYKLYPDLSKGGARSEFSKKYRGEDDNHNKYDFDEVEINKLYNMRDDFINRAGLDKNAD